MPKQTAASVIGSNRSDFLEGTSGNDTFMGKRGADTFVLRKDGGDDFILDFNRQEGDRVLFDYGTYSDVLYLGPLYDGLEFNNFNNTATWNINAVDANSDGVTDTLITVEYAGGEDSITLLGVAPDTLTGAALFGG